MSVLMELNSQLKSCQRCHLIEYIVNAMYKPLPGRWYPEEPQDLDNVGLIIGMNPNRSRVSTSMTFGSLAARRWLRMVDGTLKLDGYWVTNLVKCSTMTNEIHFTESMACSPWVTMEVLSILPRLVILSGSDPACWFKVPMHKAREVVFANEDLSIKIPVVSMYHFAHTVRFSKLEGERYRLAEALSAEGQSKYVEEGVVTWS